ncbi:MAG TPA: tryptophan synthase subunit alpha [Tepidisphaeraceae bacterium]|jgi:tryptophan synthase alpha chain
MGATAATSLIHRTFDSLRERGRIGLVPFIPAGYPDLETTAACLPALQAGGASVIEVGIPFSDPIADGPVIQEAFTEALAKKLKVADVFRTVASVRDRMTVPIVAMVSYSVAFRYGIEKFTGEAKSAGFNGLILPDLPPPEAQAICEKVQAGGLDTTLLVAPTTAPERRKQIADLSSGFVYYLSVSGITGERDQLPPELAAKVKELRALTDRPVCVGFGIHKPRHVAQLSGIADGAIVGTAYVRRMKQHQSEGPAGISRAVEAYTRELLSDVPQG